jgi:hypothetical protein
MRGVFPTEVVRYDPDLTTLFERTPAYSVAEYSPELHALQYEWYFTPSTARELSREFVTNRTITVCMGVPTVALAAVRERKNPILIDNNAHLLLRFPELTRASEVHIMDALRTSRIEFGADVAIFDSPWYIGDVLGWLKTASHVVRPGGTIVFALFPSLIRPAAILERDLIVEVASAIGKAEITEDALAYETPLFEHEALNASRLQVGDWRRGDLVVIKNVKANANRFPAAPSRREIDGPWQTFLIGRQIVKTRNSARVLADELLARVGESFVFPAVSARDAARSEIHVWTSRNRVAAVADSRVLADILSRIADGASLGSAVQTYESTFGHGIGPQLSTFLGLED